MLGALSLALFAALPLELSDAKQSLLWRGEVYELDEDGAGLPEGLGDDARAALTRWMPLAERYGLELALSEDELLLLCIEKGREEALETVEAAAAIVNALLPAPNREDAPKKLRVRVDRPDGSWEESWSSDNTSERLGKGTGVLLQMREGVQYESLLRRLRSDDPTLADWAKTAKTQYGFAIPRPLVAAWIEGGRINEEWNAKSELVHRTVSLLLWRNFGEIPFWIQLGLCWHVEMEICKGVWCFPYRDGFVWASEHTGWDRTLKSRMKKRSKQPFSIEDVTRMTREVVKTSESDVPYRDSYLITYGTIRCIAWNSDLSLYFAEVCEALRIHRLENGRRWIDKENWELILGYRIPPNEQAAIFEGVLGEEVWSTIDTTLRKGVPRPSKSKR